MPPWIGPGPHDRDLDHQVVETFAASAAAASTSARAIRSGTRRWCRRLLDHRVGRRHRLGGIVAERSRSRPPCSHAAGRSVLRIAGAACPAPAIDLQQPERLQVVLVPLDDGALGHRRVLHRHQASTAAARRSRSRPGAATGGAGSRCSSRGEREHAAHQRRLAGSKPRFAQALVDIGAPSHQSHRLASSVDLVRRQAERLARRRAPRCAPR